MRVAISIELRLRLKWFWYEFRSFITAFFVLELKLGYWVPF